MQIVVFLQSDLLESVYIMYEKNIQLDYLLLFRLLI